jgi:uncharacterized protein (DUF4415 family)
MRNGGANNNEFKKELKKRRWREIDRSHRAHIPPVTSARDLKSRITIYLDSDIITKFKAVAEERNERYQTLINNTLRLILDEGSERAADAAIKEDLLKDKKFLKRLKAALSA